MNGSPPTHTEPRRPMSEASWPKAATVRTAASLSPSSHRGGARRAPVPRKFEYSFWAARLSRTEPPAHGGPVGGALAAPHAARRAQFPDAAAAPRPRDARPRPAAAQRNRAVGPRPAAHARDEPRSLALLRFRRAFERATLPKRAFERATLPKRAFERATLPKRAFERATLPKRAFERASLTNPTAEPRRSTRCRATATRRAARVAKPCFAPNLAWPLLDFTL